MERTILTNNINPDIHAIARWAIEEYGVYSSSSGITNNQSEAMNCVIKQLQNWHESPVDCMALSLGYMVEIYRGQHGLGSYHVHPQLKSTVTLQIPDFVVHSPGDIVEQIRDKLQGTIDSISSIEEKKLIFADTLQEPYTEAASLPTHPRKQKLPMTASSTLSLS